jgi:hypothetical protein
MLKTAGEQVKRKGCGGDVVQNFHLRENESDFRDNTGKKASQTYLKFPLTLSLSPGPWPGRPTGEREREL